jgi:hypothetical protein
MTITYANHRDTEVTENAQSFLGLSFVRGVGCQTKILGASSVFSVSLWLAYVFLILFRFPGGYPCRRTALS